MLKQSLIPGLQDGKKVKSSQAPKVLGNQRKPSRGKPSVVSKSAFADMVGQMVTLPASARIQPTKVVGPAPPETQVTRAACRGKPESPRVPQRLSHSPDTAAEGPLKQKAADLEVAMEIKDGNAPQPADMKVAKEIKPGNAPRPTDGNGTAKAATVGSYRATAALIDKQDAPAFKNGSQPIMHSQQQAGEPNRKETILLNPPQEGGLTNKEGGDQQTKLNRESTNTGKENQIKVKPEFGIMEAWTGGINRAEVIDPQGSSIDGNRFVLSQAQMNTILDQMVQQIKKAPSSIELQLKPEILGNLKILVQVVEGSVSISMAAQNSETVAMLNANLANVRTQLEQQGINLQQMEVNLGYRENRDQPSHSRGSGGQPMASADPEGTESTNGDYESLYPWRNPTGLSILA